MRRAIVFSGNLQNVGDLAVLLQAAHGLRTKLNIDTILVRQWAPVHPDVRKQLDLNRIEVLNGKNIIGCLRSLRGSLLLFGGGQMVRDNASLASITFAAIMMGLCRFFGGQSAAIGCGASRIKKIGHLAVWKYIAGQLSIFAARDRGSLEVMLSFKQPIKIVQTADLIHVSSALTASLRDESRGNILVAPCQDASEEREIPPALVAEIVAEYFRKTGTRSVVVACHDSGPGMDLQVAEVIASELLCRGNETSIHTGYVLQEFFDLYRTTGLVVTNRLHSLLFAAIAGKPVILVDDGNRKTKEAAADLGIPCLSAEANSEHIAFAVNMAKDRHLLDVRAARLKEFTAIADTNFSLLADEIVCGK